MIYYSYRLRLMIKYQIIQTRRTNQSLEGRPGSVIMTMDSRYSDGAQFLKDVTVKIQNRLDRTGLMRSIMT